jgi:hypothetical protein
MEKCCAKSRRRDRRRSFLTTSCEVSWFSALCDDDYEFLSVPDPRLQSSFEHFRNIVLQAESGGFDNILLPSGYALGIDTMVFASAMAALTRRIKLMMAVRIGENWPPQLARQIATIDRITNGGLSVNIISSEMPGETLRAARAIPHSEIPQRESSQETLETIRLHTVEDLEANDRAAMRGKSEAAIHFFAAQQINAIRQFRDLYRDFIGIENEQQRPIRGFADRHFHVSG